MSNLSAGEKERIGNLLERRLAKLRGEIINELASSGETHYVDLATRVADTGDQAMADLISETEATIVSRQFQEVLALLAAQQRVADDSIGTCIDCAGDIGIERLLAQPNAQRCVRCQRRHEHEFGFAPIPSL
jgi:RNA polymerase-binding transcription factor DksA